MGSLIVCEAILDVATKPNKTRKLKTMNSKITSSLALGLSIVVGCATIQTPARINATGTAIGYAAGLVVDQTKIKDSDRNTLVIVMNEVRSCIPNEGQSFVDAWTPVIQAKVAELIEAGKLTKESGAMVASIAILSAQAVDYMFDIRFPQAKQYEELVRAGVSGAIDGFLAAFKPANDCDGCTEKSAIEFDKEAYQWFQRNIVK